MTHQTRPRRPLPVKPYPFVLKPGEVQEKMELCQHRRDLRWYNHKQSTPRPLRVRIFIDAEPTLMITMRKGPAKGKSMRHADRVLFEQLALIPGARYDIIERSPTVYIPLTPEAVAMIPQYEVES
jgi:hypothetical protein